MMHTKTFSPNLQAKIDALQSSTNEVRLGSIAFKSPYLLAPMAGICNAPFRLLMEELGAGGTVSELISCDGIGYLNARTRDMLRIHPQEKNVGIQLFGEDPKFMSMATKEATDAGAKFVDINMGCPVKKVVTKGAGSALMKDPKALPELFSSMKKATHLPITIKIRTGWDQDTRNALEIIHIAKEEGIEFVAIHGRTRAQQYTGKADWDFIENMAQESKLPIIGNGDLHSPYKVTERWKNTNCSALMIARGCLRNPFIFLESNQLEQGRKSLFTGPDYFEVVHRLYHLISEHFPDERIRLVQLRKLIVWFAAGFRGAAHFRTEAFASKDCHQSMMVAEKFFTELGDIPKYINQDEEFMTSGHG